MSMRAAIPLTCLYCDQTMPQRLTKFYYLKLVRVFKRVARSSGSARSIAVGAAIGMVVAMTPTVGLQMLIATGVCVLFRANPLPAIPMVWLTNPITIIPIYTFNYWVGTLLVQSGPRLSEFREKMATVIHLSENVGIGPALKALGRMGWEMQLPLWVGCFVVGGILAIPTYFLFLNMVTRIRKRLVMRRAARQARQQGITIDNVGSSEHDAGIYVQSDQFGEIISKPVDRDGEEK